MKELLSIGSLSDNELFQEYGYLAEIVEPILPSSVISCMKAFKNDGSHTALLIEGLPIDDSVVTTPKTGYMPNWAMPISVKTQFSIYGLLGLIPVVYEGENRTRLVRQVVPVENSSLDASSHGSAIAFGYHVDNPDLPLLSENCQDVSGCPEFLSLYGVRSKDNVPTTIVSVDEVVASIDKSVLQVLQCSLFNVRRPASFDANRVLSNHLPLLTHDETHGWLCRLDVENTYSSDNKANKALQCLKEMLGSHEFDVDLILNPGDFLIFKNQKILHTRGEFTPNFDGKDRWLMRMFGLSNSRFLIPVSNDCPYVCRT